MEFSTINNRTKWAINYIIKKEHLSNIKLAEKMSYSPGAINSYRTGQTIPPIEFVLKFCELFEFSLLWFIEGWGWPFKGAWVTHPESKGPNIKTSEPNYSEVYSQEIDKPMVMLCDDSLNITNVDNVYGKIEGSKVRKYEAKQEYAPIKISDDLALAAKVLESGTPYATALHLNIQSFARAIDTEDRLGNLESQIVEMKAELKNIKDLREKDRIRKEDLPDERVEIIKQRAM